jgi:amidohydrolase
MMIADGALQNPDVERIYGQHVHPSLPVGKIGYHPGFFMASCDELFITVIGRGGHGAMPQDTIDPIMISAELIQSLQTIVSRNANPNTPSVLSIGKINSDGGATNVIPTKVMMEGTFRTFDEDWRKEAHRLIEQRIQHIIESHGAQVELEIKKGYPSLYNDPPMTHSARDLMIQYIGESHVIELPQRMTAEDFSYYSQVVPACFYRLGTAAIDGTKNSPVHTPTFDIDEDALERSSGLMAWLAMHK